MSAACSAFMLMETSPVGETLAEYYREGVFSCWQAVLFELRAVILPMP